MRAREFLRAVTADHTDALDRFLAILGDARVQWCLVGGLAVSAYVDPVVTLDMDLVLAAGETDRLVQTAEGCGFTSKAFAHSTNLSSLGSDLRIQIQTDPRYNPFVERAQPRDVLALTLPVAAVENVLQGKIWAFQDSLWRASKRQKDLADISRLLEAFPALRVRVSEAILERVV